MQKQADKNVVPLRLMYLIKYSSMIATQNAQGADGSICAQLSF